MKKPAAWIGFFIAIAVVVISSIVSAPRFLLYSLAAAQSDKADAIVLLLGENFNARKKEVDLLSSKGLADYVIIPAYYKMHEVTDKGLIDKFISPSAVNKEIESSKILSLIYENTHLELLEAKNAMSQYNINSVVFVSSPYHMRRIKIIASEVFGKKTANFYYMPTRFEKAPADFWELSRKNWKNVGAEYLKIIWFFIYAKFIK